MLSLCRRVALASVAARPACQPALALVSCRTLFATPQSRFSPAETPLAASEGAAVEKEVSNATPTEDQEKQTKQRVRIPKNLRPPKAAPNPFFLFIQSFIKSQPKANSLQEYQVLAKRAGEIWRAYSAAEKQPFYDEFEARQAQAKEAKAEFFRNTSSSDLKKLNALRKAMGKPALRPSDEPAGVASPFVLFFNEFRVSSDGQALIDAASPDKKYIIRATQTAADCWRSMSEEEKAPYYERSRKAREEFKAAHADS